MKQVMLDYFIKEDITFEDNDAVAQYVSDAFSVVYNGSTFDLKPNKDRFDSCMWRGLVLGRDPKETLKELLKEIVRFYNVIAQVSSGTKYTQVSYSSTSAGTSFVVSTNFTLS